MLTYSDLLKDPRWQKKRLRILERDNWACVNCEETTRTLHVHHKIYLPGRTPWEYFDGDLETLCVDCHEIATKIDRDLKEAEDQLLIIWRRLSTFQRLIGPSLLRTEFLAHIIDELAKRKAKTP